VTIGVPMFLLTFLAAVILVIRAFFQFAVRRRERAIKTVRVLAALVLIYIVALVGASLVSQPTSLALGDPKCFDDWCFVVDKVSETSDGTLLSVATLNHGRRPQKPDTPRAFTVYDGVVEPLDVPHLTDRIAGHSENPFQIKLRIPSGIRTADFLVTEGGGPSVAVIGDENSPLHPKSVWHIRPASVTQAQPKAHRDSHVRPSVTS